MQMLRAVLPVPLWTPLLALLTAALRIASPLAAEPHISGLEVAFEGRQALLSFRLEEATGERFLQRVESGLPTGFELTFELVRQRRGWFDRTLDSNRMQVVAMYDAMAREYLVNYKLGGKLIRSRMVRDLDALKEAMTHFEREPIFHLDPMPPDLRLRIRLRAELGSKTIFSLIPARVTTEWVESERFRPPS